MTLDETLAVFAQSFLQKHYRERFLHEARNKPERLSARLCHELGEIVLPRYRDGRVDSPANAPCLVFARYRFGASTWGAAMREVEASGGGGRLIIGADGRTFFADAEGFPPPEVYAGRADLK